MDSATVEEVNPLFIQGKCFNGCEVALTVGEEKTEFYVCTDHLAKYSDYFRVMFFDDVKEKNEKQFEITDETPEDMICFFNAIDPDPYIRTITDESIELLIRLAEKFQCDLLKECLKHHIEFNGHKCESVTLDWLFCSLEYDMPEEFVKICLNVMKIDDYSIVLLMGLIEIYKCGLLKKHLKNYIEVNGPSCESPSTVFSWLVWSKQFNMPDEIFNLCLDVQKIDDGSVQSLMGFADKYQCDVLKERLRQYMEYNEPKCENAATILNWLIWSLKYHMPEQVIIMCLPGAVCSPLSEMRKNRDKIGSDLLSKLLDVKMQLNFKANELDKKNKCIAPNVDCSWCHTKKNLLYRIQWCTANIHPDVYFKCPGCVQKHTGNDYQCCEKSDFYYKCPRCQLDPSSYRNKDQCLCARKNYEIMLKEMP